MTLCPYSHSERRKEEEERLKREAEEAERKRLEEEERKRKEEEEAAKLAEMEEAERVRVKEEEAQRVKDEEEQKAKDEAKKKKKRKTVGGRRKTKRKKDDWSDEREWNGPRIVKCIHAQTSPMNWAVFTPSESEVLPMAYGHGDLNDLREFGSTMNLIYFIGRF